jgi:phospho-N-acetylmuramoyl-pentapeptide-transferase
LDANPSNWQYCAYVAAASFAMSAAVFPFYIGWLKRKQIGQYIREEGPQSHAAKAKTPTMGGLCFIIVSTVVSLTALFLLNGGTASGGITTYLPALVVTLVAAVCGFVGFADDYAKVTSKSNTGLSAKARLLIEFGLGFLLGSCMYFFNWPGSHFAEEVLGLAGSPLATIINLINAFAVIPFLVAATSNALNLHDGMDGLAGGTSIQVFAVLAAILLVAGKLPLAVVSASLVGAIGGFLLYNRYKAKVFMGDTGSLFIGGALAGLVAAGGLLFWFIPLASIYIVETISVIIQVVYFKLTKDYTPDPPMSKGKLILTKLTKRLPGEGKRFFRMAPLHHHFEAVGADKGIAEWQVVAGFWVAQLAICAAVAAAYFSLRG